LNRANEDLTPVDVAAPRLADPTPTRRHGIAPPSRPALPENPTLKDFAIAWASTCAIYEDIIAKQDEQLASKDARIEYLVNRPVATRLPRWFVVSWVVQWIAIALLLALQLHGRMHPSTDRDPVDRDAGARIILLEE
jgi:hypothetical protein